MVPVYLGDERVGRFSIDLPWTQRTLILRKMDMDVEFSDLNEPTVLSIEIPLKTRTLSVEERLTDGMDTSDIQNMLIARGVPYPSQNLQISKNHATWATEYRWRVADVTLEMLEEIFDIDEYVPE